MRKMQKEIVLIASIWTGIDKEVSCKLELGRSR